MTSKEPTKLGEVLRTAREARFIDLARVERDTKIRTQYLSALERGDYRDLPGGVYAKGFLRNYGLYLGLDPEYLIDLYRLEQGSGAAERPHAPIPPRPIAGRSRALVITPGRLAAVTLVALVAAFAVYLVTEFVTFAGTPDPRFCIFIITTVTSITAMPKRLGKFELPNKLTKIEEGATATYARFIAEPFEAEGVGQPLGRVDGESQHLAALVDGGHRRRGRRRRRLADAARAAGDDDLLGGQQLIE